MVAALCIIAPSVLFFVFMTVMFRIIEGHWPAWFDRRKPRPPISLAIDVLSSPIGWSVHPYSGGTMMHESGLSLRVSSNEVRQMTVGGKDIALWSSEKRALLKAIKLTAEKREAAQSEEALLAWAENVQQYVDNVVSIKRRRS